jgi:hypothetical protein
MAKKRKRLAPDMWVDGVPVPPLRSLKEQAAYAALPDSRVTGVLKELDKLHVDITETLDLLERARTHAQAADELHRLHALLRKVWKGHASAAYYFNGQSARAGELMRRALALSRRPEELTSGLKEAENDQDH